MSSVVLFVISSLFASLLAIEQWIAEYWFALIVLAVYPVMMFHWASWFLRTLRELRG